MNDPSSLYQPEPPESKPSPLTWLLASAGIIVSLAVLIGICTIGVIILFAGTVGGAPLTVVPPTDPPPTDRPSPTPAIPTDTPDIPGTPGTPVPPITGRIAFSAALDDKLHSIYIINADGTDLVRLTTASDPLEDNFPAWSPDGSQIAYVSSTLEWGKGDIWVVDVDGSSPVNLTNNLEDNNQFPYWSPNGQQIAYTAGRTDRTYRVMNSDGSNKVDSEEYPGWGFNLSPDGTLLLFASGDSSDDTEIVTASPDHTNRTQLTDNDASEYAPAWSPDGKRIAFESDRGGMYQIFLMDADGKNVIALTSPSCSASYPVWSPDGIWIAYVSICGNSRGDIYVMNADGSNATNVTRRPGNYQYPVWAP